MIESDDIDLRIWNGYGGPILFLLLFSHLIHQPAGGGGRGGPQHRPLLVDGLGD